MSDYLEQFFEVSLIYFGTVTRDFRGRAINVDSNSKSTTPRPTAEQQVTN